MPGNKKSKKAYKPRPIYRPQILNSFLFFNPFIRALDALAERQEMRIDDFGNYVIDNGSGKLVSFTEAIDVFVRYVEVLFVRIKRDPPQLKHIKVLAEISRERLPFDYDNIMYCRQLLELYMPIIGSIPPLTSHQILNSVRTQLAMDQREITPELADGTVVTGHGVVYVIDKKETCADIVKPDAGELLTKAAAQFQEVNDRVLERGANTMVLERVIPEDASDGVLLGGVFEMTARPLGAQKKKD